MNMERGFRAKLDDYLNTAHPLQIRITTNGPAVYDTCCFGVDSEEKLSDDKYMVFYNQTASPGNEISLRTSGVDADYQVHLLKLPDSVSKLVFTVSIDGNGKMSQIWAHRIQVIQDGETRLEMSMSASDFNSERAIIGIEIYKKSVWRIAAVGRGFNGGLDALLRNFGGEVAGEAMKQNTAAAHQPAKPERPQFPHAAPNPARPPQ